MNRLAALGTTLVLALNGSPLPVLPHPGTRISPVIIWGWAVLTLVVLLFVGAILVAADAARRTPRRPV